MKDAQWSGSGSGLNRLRTAAPLPDAGLSLLGVPPYARYMAHFVFGLADRSQEQRCIPLVTGGHPARLSLVVPLWLEDSTVQARACVFLKRPAPRH